MYLSIRTLVMLGRTFFEMLVPMLIAFFFGVLGRSQGTGIGVTLGFLITEQVSENALGELGRWGMFGQKLLLSTANETLMDHNVFGLASIPAGFPSEGRAALTLAVYGLLVQCVRQA